MPRLRRAVARRELGGVLREKSFVLAIAIQVFVAGFSSFLVVGLAAVFDPGAAGHGDDTPVALVGDNGLREVLEARGLEVTALADAAEGKRGVAAGRYAAVVEVSDTPWAAEAPVEVTVTAPEGRLSTTLAVVQLRDALKDYEAQLREARGDRLTSEPLAVAVDAPPAQYYGFVYTVLVPLLLFLPSVLAGALVADSLTDEVQRGSLAILLATPLDLATAVEGKVAANALLAPALGVAWVALLAVNGIPVANWAWTLLLVLAAALICCAAAAAVALVTRDRHKAQAAYAAALMALLVAGNLLPVSPLGATAQLAAGSAGIAAKATAAAVAALAVAALAAERWALNRWTWELLEGPGGR